MIKVHPRQPPGKPSTDPADLPEHKTAYAMRDLDRLLADGAAPGEQVGVYAQRLLDDPLPWTRMRAVYRLLGLARRYGDDAVNTACERALDLDWSTSEVSTRCSSAAPRPCRRRRRARSPPSPGGSRATRAVAVGRAHLRLSPHAARSPPLPGLDGQEAR